MPDNAAEPTTLKTFYCDGQIITSPNADLPEVVDHIAMGRMFNEPPFPGECREVRFSSNTYPWLGFVPKYPQWQGNLFGKLACNKHTVRSLVEWRKHTFYLNDEVYQYWRQLEGSLVHVVNELIAYSGVALPLDFSKFPLPSEYNYREGHAGLDKFIKSIMLARDAFLPLMALCSFAIAMTAGFRQDNPLWTQRLVQRGCHTSFVEELEKSQVADFSVERIGVFIQNTWHVQPYVDRFIAANVPVWFVWHSKSTFTHHQTKIFCPSEADVNRAKASPHPHLSEAPSLPISTIETIPDAPKPFPPLPKFSRQLVGETFKEYFARQERIREEKLAVESVDNRARRLNREKAQANHQLPGKSGPHVFVWEEIDGYLIRKKLDRKEVDSEWENFTDAQQKYNSITNEWDLAREFAPAEEPESQFDESDFDQYNHPMDVSPDLGSSELAPMDDTPMAPEPAHALPIPDPLPVDFAGLLEKTYEPPAPITFLRGLEPLDLIIRNRYGFVWHDTPYDPTTVFPTSRNTPSWQTTRKVLCDSDSNWCSPSMQTPISDFVDCIVKKETLPVLFWDGYEANPEYVLRASNNRKNSVTPVTFGQKTMYLINIHPSSPDSHLDPAYEILVEDPLTALECIRRKLLTNRRDIAKHFITTGKAFITRSSTSSLPLPQASRVIEHRPLGYRHTLWQADLIDYRQYENLRNAFLLTPRARAAVKYGGIVWRLSVQSIDPEYVIAGPSTEVMAYSRPMYFEGDPARYWDDELIEAEMDIVCGVYRVYTGTNY
ncbi:hypothetical protein HWV62_803 [Athelia sp. TMB]|nr:hypothetical protein HWV62_803 [Athelia sp. TMB]